MKSFKEFLNERISAIKPTEKRKVTKEELRDMILKGESIEDVDYSDITDMSYMFNGCSSLEKIPDLDTSNVTNMGGIFNGCNSIQTIERPSDWYLYDWNSKDAPQHLKDKYPELYNKELR